MSERANTFIGLNPPSDGRLWECQCARCGSSLQWVHCSWCCGSGTTEPGELYEEDPLWYNPDDFEPCHQCGGQAAYPMCLSSEGWCEANPISGREETQRDTPEWFAISEMPHEKDELP